MRKASSEHNIDRLPRCSRHQRFAIVLVFLVVAACGGLYLGFTRGNLVAPWEHPAVPWAEMEATARTFPLPEGFTFGAPIRSGRYCAPIEFMCDSPPRLGIAVAGSDMETSLSVEDRCDPLKESINLWVKAGLRDVKFQSEEPNECTYYGTWKSFGISVSSG